MTPPYYPQETDFSCAVACLRMVLAAYGVHKTEEELRVLCDCTIFGTSALELIQAARTLGFTATRKYSLTLEDLRDFTTEGYFPIVYGVMRGDVHSLVITNVAAQAVAVLDPQLGTYQIPLVAFSEFWAPMKNLAVVVALPQDETLTRGNP
jgi:ABC-type bacteriocin/lantibiotic exporter with double-glycine peptidase domain